MKEVNVSNNKEYSRLEISLGTEFTALEYRWYKRDLALLRKKVPEIYRGKDIARKLA